MAEENDPVHARRSRLRFSGAAGDEPAPLSHQQQQQLDQGQQQQCQRRRTTEEADGDDGQTAAVPSPLAIRVRDWRDYFDEQLFVEVPERGATFHVYAAGPRDATATFLCLHGAGYTGATWALVARALTKPAPPVQEGDGGGANRQQPTPFHDHDRPFRVLAPDLRGHGLTVAEDEADLSAGTMRDDVRALWAALVASGEAGGRAEEPSLPREQQQQQQQQQPARRRPAVVIVGHSMGGAIAARACAVDAPVAPSAATATAPSAPLLGQPPPPRAPAPPPLPLAGLAGCVVVDVVEGTALAALRHARAALAARPRGFGSREEAARWALRSGTCRNREAAEVSAPTMVVERPGAEEGGQEEGSQEDDGGGEEGESDEDDGDDDEGAPAAAAAAAGADTRPRRRFPFVWRTPLARSAPHWDGWYRGMSPLFLGQLPPGLPRALVAAGADRLDRALTVGQMQGRFQLVLVSGAGHAVQEDAPAAVAGALAQLARRFRVGEQAPLGVPPPPPPPPLSGKGLGGRVLPVVAGPMMMAAMVAAPGAGAARRAALSAPSGTAQATAAAALAGVGKGEGGGSISIREEEHDDDDEGP